jgi:hypothetical protein
LFLAVGVALIAILIVSLLLTRFEKVRRVLEWLAETVFVLAMIYFVVDVLSILIVLIRNILGLLT